MSIPVRFVVLPTHEAWRRVFDRCPFRSIFVVFPIMSRVLFNWSVIIHPTSCGFYFHCPQGSFTLPALSSHLRLLWVILHSFIIHPKYKKMQKIQKNPKKNGKSENTKNAIHVHLMQYVSCMFVMLSVCSYRHIVFVCSRMHVTYATFANPHLSVMICY